jgi:ABC-type polysaccharide/polyol phosphate export permease
LLPVLLAAFSLGLGLAFALLNARLRDVAHLVQVGLICFLRDADHLPDCPRTAAVLGPPVGPALRAEPDHQFVEAFRAVLYDLRSPSLSHFAYLTVISLLTSPLARRTSPGALVT